MELRRLSLIPLVIAVGVTVVLGFLLKRSHAKEMEAPPKPSLQVKALEIGAGPIVDKGLVSDKGGSEVPPVPPLAAAWIRFGSWEDGGERSPRDAGKRLRFQAKDEQGREWPVWMARSETANYVLVPVGYPERPRSLTVQCLTGSIPLGSWEIKKLPEPHRYLSGPVGDPAKDFPDCKILPKVLEPPNDRNGYLAVQVERRPSKASRVVARLLRHDFMPTAWPRSRFDDVFMGTVPYAMLKVPSSFLPKLSFVEVEVQRTHYTRTTTRVVVPAGEMRAVRKDEFTATSSKVWKRVYPSLGPFALAPGVSFSLVKAHRASLSTWLLTIGASDTRGAWLESIEDRGGNKPTIVPNTRWEISFPLEAAADSAPAFELVFQWRIDHEEPAKRYVMALPGKMMEVPSLR